MPTPVIGMVGLVEDVRRVVQPGFKMEGDLIAVLGRTAEDVLLSEYSVTVAGRSSEELVSYGVVPKLDLELELRVQTACLQAAEAGLLKSAHDCSDGGLSVALAESCFSSPGHDAIGAVIELDGKLSPITLLFSETPSRIIISFDPADENSIRKIAESNAAPFAVIGRVGGNHLVIQTSGKTVVDTGVAQLESTWRDGLTNKLRAEALAVG